MAGNFTPAGIEYLVKNFSKGMTDLGKLDKAQQNLGKSATGLSKQFTGLGKNVLSVGAKAGGAAVAGVTALGAGVAALGVISVKTAISFESAFAGVLKTTDGLTDSMGNLNIAGMQLREGFVDLSKEVPLAFEELAAIGELGGQLGIGRDALTEFTESVAALGVSTNLSTEEAASGLARMSNIFNISTENMGGNITRLGSSIVDLGNNFATTERDILAFAERLAGAGSIAGLTQADVLGIGAAMSSVGVQAEAGGTAVQKVLLAINNAVVGSTTGFVDNTEAIDENINRLTSLNGKLVALESKAGLTGEQILQMRDEFIAAGGSAEEFGRQLGATERRQLFETALAVRDLKDETQLLRELQGTPIDAGQLEKFASVAGLAATEFEELWREDASAAFQLFVEGLGKQGDEAINTLDELGLTDQRLIRAFLSLSGAGDLLGDTLDTANSAFEENTALADEAAKRYATTESQLLIFKNTLRALGDEVGSRFLPFLNRLITAGKSLISKFADPIAKAIDEKVIPAIEGIIDLGGELFAAFQAGGTAGLVDALGLTPETIELISKISQSIQDLGTAIVAFFLPGIQQLSGGGTLDAINTAIIFLNENFEAFKGAILGVGAVLAAAAIAATLSGIITVIGAILSPIGLLIIAAGTLGAAWATNWGGIQEKTATTVAFITGIVMALVSTFQTAVLPPLQAAFANIAQVMNQLGIDWGDVWNAILGAIKIVAIGIGIAIGSVVAVMVGAVSAWASALATATSFVDDFGLAFAMIFEGIITVIDGVVKFFQAIVAGEWAAAWAAFQQVANGVIVTFLGILNFISATVQSVFGTILAFITGFAQGVITIFTNLSNVLVGNSIIPDMVARIVETFQAMVEPILNIFTSLSEGIGNLLGSLFGGGEGEGFTLDISTLTDVLPAAVQAASSAVQTLAKSFELVNNQVAVILPETLIVFLEIFVVTFEQIISILMRTIETITQMNQLIITISTVTLPQLAQASRTTTQVIITGFQQVNDILIQTDLLLINIAASLTIVADKAKEAAEAMRKGFSKAASKIKSELLPALTEAIKRLERLETQAEAAARAINQITGTAAASVGGSSGLGFQAGTGPMGFLVPPGFPDDTFPIMVTSGERVLVSPPGRSIESIVGQRTSMQPVAAVQIGTVNINNGMDMATFTQSVKRVVTGRNL